MMVFARGKGIAACVEGGDGIEEGGQESSRGLGDIGLVLCWFGSRCPAVLLGCHQDVLKAIQYRLSPESPSSSGSLLLVTPL